MNDSDLQDIESNIKIIEHNPNKFYLIDLNEKLNLWEIVEKLSRTSGDDNLVTRMRIAYNLHFDLSTTLKTGNDLSSDGIEVKTLADLLDHLEFDENLNLSRDDYHIIIDDETNITNETEEQSNRAVAKLFQQTIFLSIMGLDIQKKSEIKRALIKDRFRVHYMELKKEIESTSQFLDETLKSNLNQDSKDHARKILDSFERILGEFKRAAGRPIRIAAMGTKKAGKSVVINSLLKLDLAPTSLVLPTPNTIKYVPSKDHDEYFILKYNGRDYTFTLAEDVKDFIGKEFERAQKITGEGAGIPDMIIEYPSDELNGYEVWDTPGPNVAFTNDHYENAKQCIRDADICIFVMNFSNHLTNDEIKFLSEVYETFKNENKFYSLFITVNRIDERYKDPETKSVPRILDYLSVRLEQLDPPYKDIVLFGTSALQSFYVDGVIDLVKSDRREDGEDENETPLIDENSIRPLKRKHKDNMTLIKTVGDFLGNLEDFHGIENPTEKELYALSGIPQLWQYTQYIGNSKADMEIVNQVVENCEKEFTVLNNDSILTELRGLSDNDKKYLVELSELISGLRQKCEDAMRETKSLMNEDKLKSSFQDVNQVVESARREAQSTAIDRSNVMVKSSTLTPDDVEQMSKGTKTANIRNIDSNVLQMVIGVNRANADRLDLTKKRICESQIKKVESGITVAQEKIRIETDKVKSKVTNSTAKAIMEKFEMPSFPPTIDRLKAVVQRIQMDVGDDVLSNAAQNSVRVQHDTKTRTEYRTKTRTKYRTETREREADGIWENIKSFFGATYYEEVEVPYQETFKEPYQVSYQVSREVYDVDAFKNSIAQQIQPRITFAIDDAHDKMKQALQLDMRQIFQNVEDQCEDIGESYSEILGDFQRDIDRAVDDTSKHQQEIERDTQTFEAALNQHLKPFINTWNKILHGQETR